MANDPAKPPTSNAAHQLGSQMLNCSGSQSVGSGPRSIGTTNGARQLGSVTLSESATHRKAPVWLVVKLRYPTGMSAEIVAEHAHRIVEALKALDPDLELEYDPEHSSEDAERRNVAVAVMPKVLSLNLDERLNKLLANGRSVDRLVPIVGLSVEWDRPLAV